jgi:RNA polymerase sigma-70 factor (ECF subfamily)
LWGPPTTKRSPASTAERWRAGLACRYPSSGSWRRSGYATGDGKSLDDVEVVDLYLALGCLDSQPHALAAFEREVIPAVRRSVEQACRDGSVSAEDVLQWTREKLLVGTDGGAPKLAHYKGRGALVGWVRVVAIREALQDRRRSKRHGARATKWEAAALLAGGATMTSVDVAILRERCAESFEAAVREALTRLSAEQRALLRFHTYDQLSIDQIAPMLGVHRATAARRLEKARADALDLTRAILRERHGLTDSEARSLCRELGASLEMSLGRALAEEAPT